MSAVAGLLSQANASENLDEKGDLVGEYQQTILVRNAKGRNVGTTLFGLMSKLKAEGAENTEFNWFERDPVRRQLSKNGADATVVVGHEADTIVLQETDAGGDAYQYLSKGHILRNMTSGEYMQVTADPTTNTVSVKRAIDVTAAAAVPAGYVFADNDPIVIVTLAKEEGATAVRAAYEEPEVLTNFIQTFNSSVNLTNAFKANKLRSDAQGPLRDRRVQALERIAKDIELAYFLGVKNRITGSGGGYEYMTGGLKAAVDVAVARTGGANALDGNGATGVTLDNFNAWLRSFLTVGSDAKLAFCGPTAYSVISTFANNATNGFRIMGQTSIWGLNITTINTPFGQVDLAFHPLFQEISSFSDWAFVVDMAHIKQKSMEPLFLEPNIQTPGSDSYQEQFRAKLGLKLGFGEAFGYAYDLEKITLS